MGQQETLFAYLIVCPINHFADRDYSFYSSICEYFDSTDEKLWTQHIAILKMISVNFKEV